MDEETHVEHGHEVKGVVRDTAPMQDYTTSQVWLGLALFAVGVVVTFLLPYLLA
jgi:hypothetical protein